MHPRPEKKVGIFDVYRHFETIKWTNKDCMSPTHPAYPAGRPPQDRILACWIYGELFRARNDFAHGNPAPGLLSARRHLRVAQRAAPQAEGRMNARRRRERKAAKQRGKRAV
jgi:hypothetical protein